MFDATSPSDETLGGRAATLANGRAEIGFTADGTGTSLAHLYHHEPLRVLFPTPPASDCRQAALVTTSGGLVGGDRLSVAVAAGSGARAMVAAQAAEKVYRSTGPDCRIEVRLGAEAGSWLEFLPQETILFDGARLARTTRIEAAADARVLAGEMVVFGRIGSGERFSHGFLRDAWELRRDGALVWSDALLLDGDVSGPLAHPAGFDGATAAATAIYVGPDARAQLEPARAALSDTDLVRCGATLVNGVLIARFLGREPRVLRGAFGHFWRAMRQATGGLPPVLPRFWLI
jgi:urease accessory protein